MNPTEFIILILLYRLHYITIILGLIIIWKFRNTGISLMAHGVLLWFFLSSAYYEMDHRIGEDYGFFESNWLWFIAIGLLYLPIGIVIGIILDYKKGFLQRIHKQ